MPLARTLNQSLIELRRLGSAPFRRARVVEVAHLISRLLTASQTVAIEQRLGGTAFRLHSVEARAGADAPAFTLTCVLHYPTAAELTGAEQAIAGHLCDGRTVPQIAQLRGVSVNTVKSQVRQIFRKLNVESRVALVRRLCP
ncbi:MAG: helix-turn-helix transcriptional regulator [Pseudomonadota bacterium]